MSDIKTSYEIVNGRRQWPTDDMQTRATMWHCACVAMGCRRRRTVNGADGRRAAGGGGKEVRIGQWQLIQHGSQEINSLSYRG